MKSCSKAIHNKNSEDYIQAQLERPYDKKPAVLLERKIAAVPKHRVMQTTIFLLHPPDSSSPLSPFHKGKRRQYAQ